MTSRRVVLFVIGAAIVGVAGRLAATTAETPRTVYVSASDSKGAPVTDLTAADLVVKEDGKDRVIASLLPTVEPMEVAILVDDEGSGSFQEGVLTFMQAVGEHAKYSVRQFNPQTEKILDYTNDDVAAIQGALDRIGRRGKIQGHGEQILQAISESARELQQRKAPRRAILVLTMAGEGQNVKNPNIVMEELQNSGAILSVVHHQNADIGLVTGDGPRQSGGRIDRAGNTAAFLAGVKKVADALTNQYALTYTLPDGVAPSDRVSVSTSRKGISLFAPTRIPVK